MRVLLISDFVLPVRGGLELHVERLAEALVGLGDEVAVATLTADPGLADRRIDVRTVRTATGRLLPYERSDRPFHPPLPDPLARHDLSTLVAEFRPDVVHAHSWLGVSAPHLGRVPLVFTAHDYAQICPIRTMVRPDGSFCTGPGVRKCAACGEQKYRPAVSKALAVSTPAGRRLLRPRRVIAVSEAVRSRLAPHVRAPIDVIPNFVDDRPPAHSDSDSELPFDVTRPYVLFAGRMDRSKGVDDLLAVWSRSPELPHLVVATTNPAEATVELPNVSYVSLAPSAMPAAWSSALLALVPSRWPDPCPTVVLEAFRAGTPVVGYATGGIAELVRDGVDGLLVPVGDVEGLRAAIVGLLADDGLRRRFAADAARRVDQFTTSSVVPRIRRVYRDVTMPNAGGDAGARSST